MIVLKVLIACEESQAVCKEFRRLGHKAYSCDLLPCSGGHPEWHFQQDIFSVINCGTFTTQNGLSATIDKWNVMIAFPPCTYLTVTANKWLKEQPERKSGKLVGKERQKARDEAIEFFLKLLNANIEHIAIENPIGAVNSIISPTQIIHPYYFGDATTKATCLWLNNLPKLKYCLSDNLFDKKTSVEPIVYTSANGNKYPKWSMIDAAKIKDLEERSKFRSKTFPGIAKAIAEQYSNYLQ